MKIRTVRGDISPEELGVTLPHEHVFVDISVYHGWWGKQSNAVTRRALANAKVNITNLGELRIDFSAIKDNLILDDFELAVKELSYYKRAGGKSLVECSNRDMGRDVVALREVSEVTGLNIICGCGHYIGVAHPEYVKEWSVEKLADEIIKEITEGIDGTDIKAGIIGEIGALGDMSPSEEKVVRAAARAQKETGAPIYAHLFSTDIPKLHEKFFKILEDEGANLEKVVMCHQCLYIDPERHIPNYKYHEKLAEKGVYISYDSFGGEFWQFPKDTERIEALIKLINDGYIKQILISHDTCTKTNLKSYGGFGYAHILKTIVPALRNMGLSKNEIQTLLVENPKRVLSF